MKKYVGKTLLIVGKSHPHYGEKVTGIESTLYKEEEALICKNDKGKTFYVFDEEDITDIFGENKLHNVQIF